MNRMLATATTDLKLFSGSEQSWNFSHMRELFQTTSVPPAYEARPIEFGPRIELPKHFKFLDQKRSTQELLERTDTFAFLVTKHGALIYEKYFEAGDRRTHWISWSIAKSVVSALVGIAQSEGKISSLSDPISKYATELEDTAYRGVSIRHILQMSSGIRWNEDYSDPAAEIHQIIGAMSGAGSFNGILHDVKRDFEPGTRWRYCSADTQALGCLIRQATGQSLSSYFAEKLADPLGFESWSHWITDREGTEMACGGLLLVPRDFVRFGELFRNNGKLREAQILPPEYIAEFSSPGDKQFEPGAQPSEGEPIPVGYGLHWWLPWADRGQFAAVGIYNQYIYVDPPSETVIVKLSANRNYGTSSEVDATGSPESLSLFRAIAEAAT